MDSSCVSGEDVTRVMQNHTAALNIPAGTTQMSPGINPQREES